jgi:hypothetical protein
VRHDVGAALAVIAEGLGASVERKVRIKRAFGAILAMDGGGKR